MKKFIVITLALFSFSATADIIRNPRPTSPGRPTPQIKPDGFTCIFVTDRTKRKIEITGFSESVENLPKKYEKMMWPGQAVALDVGQKEPSFIFDLVKFSVSRSGFAGKSVTILAQSDSQNLEIRFSTGSSSDINGTVKITTSQKTLAKGPVACKLIL